MIGIKTIALMLGALVVVGGIGAIVMAEMSFDETPPLADDEMIGELHLNDLDGDGIANCEDPDDDGDGLNDTADMYPFDHDNDGIDDLHDDDDDNDGILDLDDEDYVGDTAHLEDRIREMRQEGKGKMFHRGNRNEVNARLREMRTHKIMKAIGENDLDSDGIPNCEDPDNDGDGLNDTVDSGPFDHDNDGIPDWKDDDDDNDGILDTEDDGYVGNTTAMDQLRERVKDRLNERIGEHAGQNGTHNPEGQHIGGNRGGPRGQTDGPMDRVSGWARGLF